MYRVTGYWWAQDITITWNTVLYSRCTIFLYNQTKGAHYMCFTSCKECTVYFTIEYLLYLQLSVQYCTVYLYVEYLLSIILVVFMITDSQSECVCTASVTPSVLEYSNSYYKKQCCKNVITLLPWLPLEVTFLEGNIMSVKQLTDMIVSSI